MGVKLGCLRFRLGDMRTAGRIMLADCTLRSPVMRAVEGGLSIRRDLRLAASRGEGLGGPSLDGAPCPDTRELARVGIGKGGCTDCVLATLESIVATLGVRERNWVYAPREPLSFHDFEVVRNGTWSA